MAITDFENAGLSGTLLVSTFILTIKACVNCITDIPTIETLQYVSNILSILLSDEPPRKLHFQQISATEAPQYIAEQAIIGALTGLTIYGVFAAAKAGYNFLFNNNEGMAPPPGKHLKSD